MPTYEMPILLRVMKRPDHVATLKRVATTIFSTGGFIRKIENLGVKELPVKASAHGHVHKMASHFLFYFDVPPLSIANLFDECTRDIDIIRTRIYKKDDPTFVPCTLHEEMLPPPYRKEVQQLLELSKRKEKRKNPWINNTGFEHYPFQK